MSLSVTIFLFPSLRPCPCLSLSLLLFITPTPCLSAPVPIHYLLSVFPSLSFFPNSSVPIHLFLSFCPSSFLSVTILYFCPCLCLSVNYGENHYCKNKGKDIDVLSSVCCLLHITIEQRGEGSLVHLGSVC